MNQSTAKRSEIFYNRIPDTAKAVVVLVARPGPFSTSLQRLLQMIPTVGALYQFQDGVTLLNSAPKLQPSLLLFDGALLQEEQGLILPHLQARWPQARTIALIENEAQAANLVGIELVLTYGVLAARLWETIETLLQDAVQADSAKR